MLKSLITNVRLAAILWWYQKLSIMYITRKSMLSN